MLEKDALITPERLKPGTETWEMYIAEHRQRYLFAAQWVQEKVVLDVACGVGFGTQILSQNQAAWVVGVDISSEALGVAQDYFSDSVSRFCQSNGERLPFNHQQFDLVVCFETLEHVPHPEKFFSEIHRVLKSDGILISSIPNIDFLHRGKKIENPYHISEMPLADFEALYRPYFKLKKRFYQAKSARFNRHEDLVEAVNQINETLRLSRCLRFENFLRRLCGRQTLSVNPLSNLLWRVCQDDYKIAELVGTPQPDHSVFIHIGQKR
jgi:2-polyprenyl-3-methyl-5-hydroxy-6-metoxy-1,4-benzoquinol methylase